jgi:hypothetical protein
LNAWLYRNSTLFFMSRSQANLPLM